MEYTVQKLALLAGVSARTLRYYDEFGILKPARINSSGYRIYGAREVALLQQILFYRELGVGLDDIKGIVTAPDFDGASALREHHRRLLDKRDQLCVLIENVEKTIAVTEGRMTMGDKEKFEGFKKRLVDENEEKYGKEIRQKYGNDTVNKSNAKVMNMTEEEHAKLTKMYSDTIELLLEAYKTGDPACEKAQQAAELHKQWLCFYWDQYSKVAHRNLGEMYVYDERFKKNYDQHQEGLAEFFRDAINIYAAE